MKIETTKASLAHSCRLTNGASPRAFIALSDYIVGDKGGRRANIITLTSVNVPVIVTLMALEISRTITAFAGFMAPITVALIVFISVHWTVRHAFRMI